MADVFEVYNRCGSCRHFRPAFTDRMGRTMGECHGKPTHPNTAAHEFGCAEYHLDRTRLLPGSAVPEDADLSPRQREMQRRMEAMRTASTRHARTDRVRMARTTDRHDAQRSDGLRGHDDETRPKLQDIPLDIDDDEEEGTTMNRDTLKAILAEVLDETIGVTDAPLHPRYKGGKLIVQPANPELAAKELEVDVLFRKVVSIRDKLRVLEQKINASDKLDSGDKVQLQQYITGCYGALTSFNYLFRERDDWFVGQSSD